MLEEVPFYVWGGNLGVTRVVLEEGSHVCPEVRVLGETVIKPPEDSGGFCGKLGKMFRNEPVVKPGGISSSSKGELTYLTIDRAPNIPDMTTLQKILQTEPCSFTGIPCMVTMCRTSMEAILFGAQAAV